MFRHLLAFALLISSVGLRAQEGPALHGSVQERTYVSPTGAFKVTIPVLPELGGNISDTPNVVTFQDAFNLHVSIAVFPQDATQRWEMSTRGTKDYLAYFFANVVLPEYRESFDGVQAESARFIPGLMDGALIAYTLIPGGSMFLGRVAQLTPDRLPVAKRGNLVFVKNGDIYVISTELAERVIEGRTYNKTAAEEDLILRQRLEDVTRKMQFLKPAAPKPSSAPVTAPASPASK